MSSGAQGFGCDLRFEQVSFGYGGQPLFRDLSVAFPRGAISCIVGPNGCGKSTLAKLACGFLVPQTGKVELQGRDVRMLAPKQRARSIALFEQQQAVPAMTVEQYVACGRFPYKQAFSGPSKADVQAVDQALRDAGVTELRGRALRSLSGGQRQRVRMALVLAQQAPVVFFDEPTSFMDVAACFDAMDLVRSLRSEERTVVAVVHDLDMALKLADRVFVLDRGAMIAHGSPESDQVQQAIQSAFRVRLELLRGESGVHWTAFRP